MDKCFRNIVNKNANINQNINIIYEKREKNSKNRGQNFSIGRVRKKHLKC